MKVIALGVLFTTFISGYAVAGNAEWILKNKNVSEFIADCPGNFGKKLWHQEVRTKDRA